MKRLKVFKVLGISLLAIVVLTWLIPSTNLNMSNVLERGSINPAGILDIFGSLDILAMYFTQNSIIVLLVGALYAVMNKTGAYKILVDKIASKFKKNKWAFLLTTILFFILVPAFTNIYFLMFIFVPLFISVISALGYNKKTMLVSTVGSVLVGISAGLFNKSFLQYAADPTDNTFILIKLGFLLLSLGLTIFYVLKTSDAKKDPKNLESNEELLLVPTKRESENKTKRGIVPLVVIFGLVFVFIILGMTNWNTEVFSNVHASIMSVSIGEFAIFAKIFGSFNAFGAWTYAEIYVLLISASIVIALFYKLKIKEYFEAIFTGVSKFAFIALIVCLVNIAVIFTLNSGFFATIINLLSKGGNTALITMTSIFGTPLVVDSVYHIQYNLGMISSAFAEYDGALLGLIGQMTYGVTLLVAPTSILVLAGLIYVGEGFKTWFKYIWKLAAFLMVLVFIGITIASLI